MKVYRLPNGVLGPWAHLIRIVAHIGFPVFGGRNPRFITRGDYFYDNDQNSRRVPVDVNQSS
jgi:hypothetical protein